MQDECYCYCYRRIKYAWCTDCNQLRDAVVIQHVTAGCKRNDCKEYIQHRGKTFLSIVSEPCIDCFEKFWDWRVQAGQPHNDVRRHLVCTKKPGSGRNTKNARSTIN